MKEKDRENIVKAFATWGFLERGETSNGQRYGDCPLCEAESKFYINTKNSLWDCKKCSKSGNYLQFIHKIALRNAKALNSHDLKTLSKDRGLSSDAFKTQGVGIWGSTFSLPVFGSNGKIQDLRRYRVGNRIKGSIFCNIGLWGADKLYESSSSVPVFLCEGEWDGIALEWLLKKTGKSGVVVAVPGANTFKTEWVNLFQGRTVYACYDNDEPGDLGDLRAEKKLSGVVKKLYHLHWSQKLPSGFDIRDLVRVEAVKRNKPKRTYRSLMKMFKSSTRKADDDEVRDKTKKNKKEKEIPLRKVKVQEVYNTFQKWLHLKNTDGIQILLATIVANRIEGDPVWMFLVAPPGAAKTELIQALNGCEQVHPISSLTPHTLISGASWTGGADPSLIPKLNKKVLAIKDFTTIMELRHTERDEIFGVLRDSYDGNCVKMFGNGIIRKYESRFGIVAAVTPAIYALDSQNQSLGERFLKFSIETNLKHFEEEEIIGKAISNINREPAMRKEISDSVAAFINWRYHKMENLKLPKIPDDIKKKIISLCKFGSRLRGIVARDKYRSEMVDSRPSAEMGSRLGKQMAKLGQALALVNGRKEVNEDDYRLLKKCMLDTVSQKIEDVVRCIYVNCPDENDSITTKSISFKTRYPQSTVVRTLADMFMLEIVVRSGKSNRYEWILSDYIKDLVERADIYARPKNKPTKKKKKFRRLKV